jgi:hypothetical protein
MDITTSTTSNKKISDYKRPQVTYTDTLTKEQIDEFLIDYEAVNNYDEILLGSHIRYFIIDKENKENKFRLGGTVLKKNIEDGYIMLESGNLKWSVQLNNSILFKKINIIELKEKHDKEIRDYKEIINILNKKIDTFKDKIRKLKKNKNK